jgi:hypothetical protein
MRRISSLSSRGVVAAMEEEELAAEVAAAEAPIGDNAESVETELLEVNEEAAVADEADAQVEEAVETVEALEQMAIALESAAAAGGLDKNAALLVGIAADSMYKRVGFGAGRQGMPALEAFGGVSTRVGATQLALEDMKSKIADIWKAIIAHIEKAIAWVKERFLKIFGAAEKIKARAAALSKRAEGTKGSAKESTVNNARVFKALEQGGDVRGVAAATALKDATAAIATGAGKQVAIIERMAGMVAEGKLEKIDTDLTSVIPGLTKGGEAPEGLVGLKSAKALPGGAAILGQVPAAGTDENSTLKALAKAKFEMGSFGGEGAGKEGLGVMSTSDAARVASIVGEIADQLLGLRAEVSKQEAANKKLIQAAKKAQSKTDAEAETVSLLRGATVGIKNYTVEPAVGFSVYAVNTSKSLLDYVELSLKQYAE